MISSDVLLLSSRVPYKQDRLRRARGQDLKMRIESKERRTAASTLAGELISGVSWLSNEMTEMSCFACKQDDG